jgi:hypothetical protein
VLSMTDLPFDYEPTPANPAAPKPKCRRHEWALVPSPLGFRKFVCTRCPAIRDEDKVRRGKNNRSRGNAIEREVGKRLGLRRVGQYGGPDDLSGELFVAQVKSGGAFPERLWSWLKAVPANAGQTPLLVVTDAPGPGFRRRALVILELDEWVALHGESGEAA